MKRKKRTPQEEQKLEELLGQYFRQAARDGAPDSGEFNGDKIFSEVQGNITRHRQRNRTIMWAAAGVTALLCTLAALYWRPAGQPQVVMLEQRTGPGSLKEVQLEDGTIVWLNAGSRIQYQQTFEHDKRQIQIEGEAYLEVAPDSKRPFEVITGNVRTKVLGTAFNIAAYPEANRTEVTVISGKVSLSPVTGNKGPLTLVGPDQQAVYTAEGQRVAFYDSVAAVASLHWKDRKMIFTGKSLAQVVAAVERWHNVKVEISGPLSDCIISADFTGEAPAQVLEVLAKLANGNVQYKEGVYHLSGTGCTY